MDELLPYMQHIGNCGAVGSTDPMDERCICGLRQVWARSSISLPEPYIAVIKYVQRLNMYPRFSLLYNENLNAAIRLAKDL